MKKKIIGLILVLLTLGALTFWEIWGRVNLTYDDIVVLNRSVPENTIITKDMLKVKKVDKASAQAIKLSEIKSILGLETVHSIPQGAELYKEYFEESKFVTGNLAGKYVLSLPSEWLKSYPQTIKRGDRAIFYCKGVEVAEATVAHVRDGTNQEVNYDTDRLQSTSSVSLIEIVVTKEQMQEMCTLADEGYKFVILYY